MTAVIVILVVSVLAQAFCSGGELALISADKVQLRHVAEAATTRARRRRQIQAFLEEPSDLISTALAGTTLCVVLSTAVMTVSLLPRYPRHAELISLGLLTPVVLIFGEIVPKSLFQVYANQTAPWLIGVFSTLRLVFYPLVLAGRGISTVLLRLVGIERQRLQMTRAELRLLITLPTAGGESGITVDERQMISRIFEFSETTATDLMLPLSEVTALPITAQLSDAAREIADKGYTRIPLYRDRLDQIEGIVHAFDVLRAEPEQALVSLARPAIFVPESQPAVDTLVRLQREKQGMAIVVDEYGGAIGVLTIEDILEEIVGEIDDEYDDQVEELIRKESNGVYRVSGRATVARLNEKARLQLPISEDYETVAGLVLEHCKRIPASGEQLTVEGAVLVVTRATERSVDEVRVIAPTSRKKQSVARPAK